MPKRTTHHPAVPERRGHRCEALSSAVAEAEPSRSTYAGAYLRSRTPPAAPRNARTYFASTVGSASELGTRHNTITLGSEQARYSWPPGSACHVGRRGQPRSRTWVSASPPETRVADLALAPTATLWPSPPCPAPGAAEPDVPARTTPTRTSTALRAPWIVHERRPPSQPPGLLLVVALRTPAPRAQVPQRQRRRPTELAQRPRSEAARRPPAQREEVGS
eukprot:scaffold741_cov303-Prasinococcus_capsulatus_cf.AAC.9